MSLLRVATCNHWDGGGQPGRRAGRQRRGRSWARLDAQLDQLRELDADVVFSTEAKHWLERRGEGLRRARRRLGMTPHLARADRHGCHLVIWTRPDRIRVRSTAHQERHPFWHALAVVEADIDGVDSPGGDPVWLVGVHLAPFGPDLRPMEARALSEFAPKLALLGGDFNDEGVGDPLTVWPPGYKQVRHEHLPGGTAAQILHRCEFLDVATAVHPDPDTRQPTAGFPDSALRCDRLYVSKPTARLLRPACYGVLPYDPDTSDHRIPFAELESQ